MQEENCNQTKTDPERKGKVYVENFYIGTETGKGTKTIKNSGYTFRR